MSNNTMRWRRRLWAAPAAVFLLCIMLLTGCDELDMVLAARTPTFLEGEPRILLSAADTWPADLLAAEGWRPLRLMEELPERFVLVTGQGDSAQILLQGKGVLEIQPETLLMVNGSGMQNVQVIQGKAVFISIPEYYMGRYRNSSTTEGKLAAINEFSRRYLTEKEGMFRMQDQLRFSTVFSSTVASKGKTFSVVVDTNHDLEYSKFRLGGLHPAFHKITDKKDFSGTHRYMAVTGLDIHEQVRNLDYAAEARDMSGNWVKVASTIPLENYRHMLVRGQQLTSDIRFTPNSDRYLKRHRDELDRTLTAAEEKARYQRVLRERNRQMAFYWKSRSVWRERRNNPDPAPQYMAIFRQVAPEKHWNGKFMVPVAGVVTSGFGVYRYYYGGWGAFHRAIDIAAPIGSRLAAPNNGKVVHVGVEATRGLNIVIDHGMGVFTCFYHMYESFVKEGDTVEMGDIIGSLGNSGLSSGPHLHWEMWVNGRQVNPLDWVRNTY